MDFVFLYQIIKKRILIIILIPALALITAFLLTKDLPPQYKSSAQLSTGFTTYDEFSLNDQAVNLREADVKFNNLIENLNSPLIIGLVSYQLILHDLTSDKPFRKPEEPVVNSMDYDLIVSSFQNALDSLKLLTTYNQQDQKLLAMLDNYNYDYESLSKNLSVKRVNYTDFLNVAFVSENPNLSAFTVNTICDEFFRYNSSIRVEKYGESLEYYRKLVSEKKQELDATEERLRIFKTSHNFLDFEIESQAKVDQITRYENQLSEEESKIRSFSVSLQNINNKINNIENGTELGNNSRIITLREKINDLNLKYINSNGNDRIVKDSLDELRRQYNAEMTKSAAGGTKDNLRRELESLKNERNRLEIELQIARDNRTKISETLNSLKYNVSDYASKEATYSALQREVEVATEEYLAAQDKLNSARNASSAINNSIKQVLYGQPAAKPESSKKIVISLFTFFSSLVLSVFGVVVIEYLDFRIKSPSHLARASNLPLIGILNDLEIKINSLPDNLINKKSSSIETYIQLLRKVRYEIEATGENIFLFTSSKQKQGKSFSIVSIAYSLNMSKNKVLIIDTNFKNNTLTELLSAKPVLEDYFTQEGIKKNSLISKSVFPNIDVIGCKGGNYSPNEIISVNVFKEFLNELKNQYDYILMEGASMNDYSDSKELIHFCDKIILLFAANHQIKQIDNDSISFLKKHESKLMGSIFNKVEEKELDL